MLRTFFEIVLAFFAVYGGYCFLINLFYIFFCKNKSNICIAYFAENRNNNFSEIIFAKKAFLGRSRAIILVNYDLGEKNLCEIKEKIAGVEVYRAERIEEVDQQFHRK